MTERTLEKLYAILQEHFQKTGGKTAPVTPKASAAGMQGIETPPAEQTPAEEPASPIPTPQTPTSVPPQTPRAFAGLSAGEIRKSLARYGMTMKDLPPEMQEQVDDVKKPPVQPRKKPPMPAPPISAMPAQGRPKAATQNRIRWNWPRGLPREKNYDRQMLKKMDLRFFRVPGQRWYKGISSLGSVRSTGGRKGSRATTIPGSTTMKEASGGGDFSEVVTVMKDLVKAMAELKDELKRGDKSKPASSTPKLTPALS